ncbi:MAG TPA: surface-adhesin E family protein [Burkholderiaceae bacterium]|nr:surface-adhesin E family protein [Burkholderiaceae bacterium]
MKTALLALLLFAWLPARAEWLKIVETSTNTVVYVDSQVAERVGEIRRVSELHDHKNPLAKHNVSTRFLSEYNCSARLVRRLQVDEFSEHMAQGNIRSTKIGLEEPWISVQPDTSAEAVMKYVCNND